MVSEGCFIAMGRDFSSAFLMAMALASLVRRRVSTRTEESQESQHSLELEHGNH